MAVEVPAIVVGDSAATSVASLPNDALRSLAAFRESTGISLVPAIDPPTAALVSDPDRGPRIDRIEATIHAARGPLELGDKDALPALRQGLAVAYAEARAHPEDPEAPLLLAEVLRTMARAEELGGDGEGAAALRARATLLDGGRKIGLSEGGADESAVTPHAIAISIEPLDAVIVIDGTRLKGSTATLADGEHHLRVLGADGSVLLARWIAIGASTSALAFRASPPLPPCAKSELAKAARITGKFSVDCRRWAVVTRSAIALDVRLCDATACAPPTHWAFAIAPPIVPVVPPKERSIFRSPWTWVAVGAAAVAGGTIAAWRLGAFTKPDAPAPTWRWEGAR